MNSKFWVYPLSVYLAAAVLFNVGCADDKKKNRIPIVNSNPSARNGGDPQLTGAGAGGSGLGGETDGPKDPGAVQKRFDAIEASAIKAGAVSTDDQINNKLAEINKGLSVKAVESLAAGTYEVKWIGLVGKLSSKEFSRHTLVTATLADLNLQNVDAALYSTAKEIKDNSEEKKLTTAQDDTNATNSKNRRQARYTPEEVKALREKNKALREQGKKNKELRDASLRDSSGNENFAKIFTFNYAFARVLKISQVDETTSQMEESNPAQVNLHLSKSAREAKLVFSKKEDQLKTISEAIRLSKPQADGTYKIDNIEIAFSQTSPEELQLTLSEVSKSTSGKSDTRKSVIIRYARKAGSAPANPAKQQAIQQQAAATAQEQQTATVETKVEVKE